MKASIVRIGILGGTLAAQREPIQRRIRSIVRERTQ
jgi:hypothetical protein